MIRVILVIILSVIGKTLSLFIPEGGFPRPHRDPQDLLLAHISTDKQVYRPLDTVFFEIYFSNPLNKLPVVHSDEIMHLSLKVSNC
jgi:hypothetical protein